MSSPAELLDLAKHMEWADALVWRAVLQSEAARPDDRIRLWLHHIHLVQQSFLRIWHNERPAWRELLEFPDGAALARWGREGHVAVQAFIAGVRADALTREVAIPWVDDVPHLRGKIRAHATLGQTMMQVMMHSMHHRAQVSARLRDLGGEPPLTDYVGWIWFGRPAADWACVDAVTPEPRT